MSSLGRMSPGEVTRVARRAPALAETVSSLVEQAGEDAKITFANTWHAGS